MDQDVIFQPLKFRNLTVKNRLFRSNVSGRFDNYDGSGYTGAHQLGRVVRARRRGRHYLVVCSGAHPGADSAELRDDRQRRQDPVLARGGRSRAPA